MPNDLNAREAAYLLILQGILVGDPQARGYPHDIVRRSIEIGDILFDTIEDRRKVESRGR